MAVHRFGKVVESGLEEIKARLDSSIPEEQKRFFSIKLFERDNKIAEGMTSVPAVEDIIVRME